MHTALALAAVASALVAAGAWVMPAEGESPAGGRLLALSALVWGVVAVAEIRPHLAGSAVALALAALGLVLLPGAPRRFAGRARTLVDGLIVATALAFVTYAAGVDSIADEWLVSSVPEWLVLAPVMAGAAAGGMALVLMTRLRGRGESEFALLGLGLLAVAAAQAAEAVSGNPDAAAAGAAGWLLVALAARWRLGPGDTAARELYLPAASSVLVPALPVAAALCAAAVELREPGSFPEQLVWIGLGLALLVIARAPFARLETIALWKGLEARARDGYGPPRGAPSSARTYDDPLTGLGNGDLLERRTALALQESREGDARVAVLRLDLDDFGELDQALGPAAGDELLVALSRRLAGAIRSGDTVARIGGDEFAVLADGIETEAQALELAHRAQHTLRDPFVIDGREVGLRGSIGIAISSGDDDRPEELLRDAGAALDAARAWGGGGVERYRDGMRAVAASRIELEPELRGALERGELSLAYQPVFDLAGGGIRAVEALVRWRHPRLGDISPSDFIPVAESSGLVVDIGGWVLGEACAQWRRWLDAGAGWARLGISVNVSARQLREPGLLGHVRGALLDSGIPPGALTLEIAERVLVEEPESARGPLEELHGLGVRIALDDFGAGHSALGSLRQFHVDSLKLERGFLEDVRRGTDAATVAAAIVAIGHALGVETVAEGVERPEQLAELRAMGCDLGQGYLLSGPRNPDGVGILLSNARRVAA